MGDLGYRVTAAIGRHELATSVSVSCFPTFAEAMRWVREDQARDRPGYPRHTYEVCEVLQRIPAYPQAKFHEETGEHFWYVEVPGEPLRGFPKRRDAEDVAQRCVTEQGGKVRIFHSEGFYEQEDYP